MFTSFHTTVPGFVKRKEGILRGQCNVRLLTYSLILTIVALLHACGGGESDSQKSSGIEGTGDSIARGPIEIVAVDGSETLSKEILVNGVGYSTENTRFFIGNAPSSLDQLKAGNFVEVRGLLGEKSSAGKAIEVHYQPNLVGEITSIIDETSLLVLNTLVSMGDNTAIGDGIDGTDITSLSVGDVVEVSGVKVGGGEILASRIDLADASTEELAELSGFVFGLNKVDKAFTLEDIIVDYNNAEINQTRGALIEGARAIAKGAFEIVPLGEGEGEFPVLRATSVEIQPDLKDILMGIKRFSLQGVMYNVSSVSEFEVDGIRVLTDDDTQYVNGTASDIGLNVAAIIDGQVSIDDGDVSLVASNITFLAPLSISAISEIASITVDEESPGSAIITFDDPPIELQVTASTTLRDLVDFGPPNEFVPMELQDLKVGDIVEAVGLTLTNPLEPSLPNILVEKLQRLPAYPTMPISQFLSPPDEFFNIDFYGYVSELFDENARAFILLRDEFEDFNGLDIRTDENTLFLDAPNSVPFEPESIKQNQILDIWGPRITNLYDPGEFIILAKEVLRLENYPPETPPIQDAESFVAGVISSIVQLDSPNGTATFEIYVSSEEIYVEVRLSATTIFEDLVRRSNLSPESFKVGDPIRAWGDRIPVDEERLVIDADVFQLLRGVR